MGHFRNAARNVYRAIVPANLRNAIIRRGLGRYGLRPFEQHRCIFVHVPKAAGISVSTSLFGNLGGGHKTIRDYIEIFGPEAIDGFFKFTFVRNPWDRVLSAYAFLADGGKTREDSRWAKRHLAEYSGFDDFVLRGLGRDDIQSWVHFTPQWQFLVDESDEMRMDFIGRYEKLAADFAHVASRLGLHVTLAHLNRSKTIDFRAHYRPAMVARVAEVYAKDIDLFAYTFDSDIGTAQ